MADRLKQSQGTKFHHKQQLICDVATRVLNEQGLRDMTLAEVADRLGLAPRSVGYYYRTKEDLAAACYQNAIEVIVRIIDTADEKDSLAERMGELIRKYFAFRFEISIGKKPDIAFFGDVLALEDEAVFLSYHDMFRRLRHLCRDDMTKNSNRTYENCRAHFLSQTLYFADFWLRDYHPENIERASEAVLDILLNGLATKSFNARPFAALEDGAASGQPPDSTEILLRAATNLMSRHGFKGASVDQICAAANLTKGAFYHHFDLKEDVTSLCALKSIERVQRALEVGDQLPDQGLFRLSSILNHLVTGQLGGDYPLLRYSGASMSKAVAQTMDEGYRRNASHFRLIVSAGISDGSIRPVDAQIAADLCMTALHASIALSNWLSKPVGLDAGSYLLDLIQNGFSGKSRTGDDNVQK